MSHYFSTEEQLKRALRIDTFRNLSKEKVIEFANSIPLMDQELAKEIINKYPEYTKMATGIIEQLRLSFNDVVKTNKDVGDEVLKAYGKVLDDCSCLLKSDEISEDNKVIITQNMLTVAEKIAEYDQTNKMFLSVIFRDIAGISLGLAGMGLAVLGVNIMSRRLAS